MKPRNPGWLALLLAACSAPLTPPAPQQLAVPPQASSAAAQPPPVATSAQPISAVQGLTLEAALALALEHHPQLTAARAQLAAARARERGAGRWSNPELIGGVESASFDGDTFGEAEFLLGFSQAIPLAGSRARAREVRGLERESSAHAAHAQLVSIRRSVSGAFATALYAQELEALFAELADNAGRGHDLLDVRVQAGDAISSDLVAVGLAHARATRELERARLLTRRSRLELAGALGTPACPIESVQGELATALQLPALALLVGRLDEHPGVLAAGSRSRAAEAGIEFAEAARIPDLQLDLLYRRTEVDDGNGFDLLVGLPLPLFSSGAAAVEEARQQLTLAQARERSTRNNAEVELRLAHLTAARALAELEFQEREVLPRMRELRDVALRQYELGDTSLVEALAARRDWLEVRGEMLHAQRNLMQAWAVLGPYLRETAP